MTDLDFRWSLTIRNFSIEYDSRVSKWHIKSIRRWIIMDTLLDLLVCCEITWKITGKTREIVTNFFIYRCVMDPDLLNPLLSLPISKDLPAPRHVLLMVAHDAHWISSFLQTESALWQQYLQLSPRAEKSFNELKRSITKVAMTIPAHALASGSRDRRLRLRHSRLFKTGKDCCQA